MQFGVLRNPQKDKNNMHRRKSVFYRLAYNLQHGKISLFVIHIIVEKNAEYKHLNNEVYISLFVITGHWGVCSDNQTAVDFG